jgi:hypothetical protein
MVLVNEKDILSIAKRNPKSKEEGIISRTKSREQVTSLQL